jgi:hypothetical protein
MIIFYLLSIHVILSFMDAPMTFKQTVEIPEDRRLTLTIEVPREFPPGAATLTFTPNPAYPPDEATQARWQAAIEKCSGIAKGILSSDDMLEMRRKDRELEEAQYRRLFSLDGDKEREDAQARLQETELKTAIAKLQNLAKDFHFSSEDLFEERRKDREMDEAQYRRLFQRDGAAD